MYCHSVATFTAFDFNVELQELVLLSWTVAVFSVLGFLLCLLICCYLDTADGSVQYCVSQLSLTSETFCCHSNITFLLQ